MSKKVMVSGCFDLLHSGHVAFIRRAAQAGDELHVCIASDRTFFKLRGRTCVNPEDERKYMVEQLKGVAHVHISSGEGMLDFAPELAKVKPDLFIVNDDGDTPEKRQLVELHNVQYVVLERTPDHHLPPRSTTQLRNYDIVPYRIDLAGGWLDQPFVSKHHPGPVIVCSIEPTHSFNTRSGLSSSTRGTALRIWNGRLPTGNREAMARTLFACDNPPGTKDIAGSQDAIGIVYPGVNKLDYESGKYWPSRITECVDEKILSFLQARLQLVSIGPREAQFEVLAKTEISTDKARNLCLAAEDAWSALMDRDAPRFGKAMRESLEAQVSMFPYMMNDQIRAVIDRYKSQAHGYKIAGAGGGGYVVFFADKPIPDAIPVLIRRE